MIQEIEGDLIELALAGYFDARSSGTGVMSKWHFENCKYKNNE
jgi:hypothetical protein